LCLLSRSSFAAAAFVDDAGQYGINKSEENFSYTATGGAGSVLVVGIGGEDGPSQADIVVTGCTYNAVAMTNINSISHSGGSNRVEHWYLDEPDNGAHTVDCNYTAGVTQSGANAAEFSGVASGGPGTAKDTQECSTCTTITGDALTVTTGGVSISTVTNGNNQTHTHGTDQIEIFDGAANSSALSMSYELHASDTTNQMADTASASTNRLAQVSAFWAQSAAASVTKIQGATLNASTISGG